MSYSFCFGPSGSGKSRLLRQMITERAQQSLRDPGQDRTRYIVVVPEQYSMQTQRELVREHPSHVLMNIDVLSFGRLAHRVFAQTGADVRTVLNDTGKSLLLRRVASRCGQDLKTLRRGIHRPGMIDEIKSVLSEFMQYGIGEEEIASMASYAGEHGKHALQARLLDLQKLFTGFAEAREGSYVTGEETLDLLAKAIPQDKSLAGSVVVFDGFTGFTTVQYRVIQALLCCAKEVIFSFTAGWDGGPYIGLSAAGKGEGSQEDLFYLSRKTAADIVRLASAQHLERGKDILLPEGMSPRFGKNRVLAHLEQSIFRYPEQPFPEMEKGETERALRMFAASTPREEVRVIFSRIHEMAARTGCAYRDFAIVTADLETYGDLFELEAARSGIPVYIDRTTSVFHNILVEGIRSVLQISSEQFSFQSVFRYLRSGLSALDQEEVDLLENYCLAHGVSSRKKWSAPFEAGCEEARIRFLREVEPVTGGLLEEAAPRRPRTAAVRTQELYAFLVGCRAQERMDRFSQLFAEEGDVVREKQYSQIYRTVIDLLDQIYELAGAEKMGARDFLELLEAGFSQIRLGTLPQRVDRVLVGDMERTRLTQIRHLFFAGANDGNIPRAASRGGILSDMDREFLAAGGVALSPSPRRQIFIQRLYLYLNMTKPSDSLTVSFSKVSQDGQSLHPSYLASLLLRLFPSLRLELPEKMPVREQIADRASGQAVLADLLRQFAEGSRFPDADFCADFSLVYGFFTSPEMMADPASREATGKIRKAALYRYRPELLSSAAAKALYGDQIVGGISRMETGARCMLHQYLKYGLRLQEREIYSFETADAGTILHNALQRFHLLLGEKGLSWKGFTPQEAAVLSAGALREVAETYRNQLLYGTKRDEGRLERLERLLLRTVDTLQYQIRRGDLVPVGAEFVFGGEKGQLPEIRCDLHDNRTLLLRGRIDRVDAFYENGRQFLRIVDYKSGRNDLDPALIRRGLQLQLIIYMEALLKAGGPDRAAGRDARESIPSAMLYYRMSEPVIDLVSAPVDPESTTEMIRKKLRPTGLVYEDEESIFHLDRELQDNSDVIPVGRTRKGDYTAASRLISPAQYRELADAAWEAVRDIAQRILDGETAALPAMIDKKRSACDYCPFSAACGFDPRLPGYKRRLPDGERNGI